MFSLSTAGIFHRFTRLGALILAIGAGSLLAFGMPAFASTFDFDFMAPTSPFVFGTQGDEFKPLDNLTITARGEVLPDIDPVTLVDYDALADAPLTVGKEPKSTLVLSSSGLGVQKPVSKGSSGSDEISGKGSEENEEVIFAFTNSVTLSRRSQE